MARETFCGSVPEDRLYDAEQDMWVMGDGDGVTVGATAFGVGWGDDVPHGKQTDFFRAVDATADETVVLCWMVWPDKATRDAAYRKMMELDPDISGMPFDGKRMIWGGFEPLLMEGTAA